MNIWAGAVPGVYRSVIETLGPVVKRRLSQPLKPSVRGIYWLEETELALGNLELGLRFDQQEITLVQGKRLITPQLMRALAGSLINQQQRLSLVLSHSERAPAAEELLS